MIAIGVNFFQQTGGQAFSSQYGAFFIQSLNLLNPFTYAVISTAINVVACALVVSVNDKFRRRTFLILGGFVQACAFCIMGGLGCANPLTNSQKYGVIAVMFINGFAFSLAWAPLCYVVTTEMPALRL